MERGSWLLRFGISVSRTTAQWLSSQIPIWSQNLGRDVALLTYIRSIILEQIITSAFCNSSWSLRHCLGVDIQAEELNLSKIPKLSGIGNAQEYQCHLFGCACTFLSRMCMYLITRIKGKQLISILVWIFKLLNSRFWRVWIVYNDVNALQYVFTTCRRNGMIIYHFTHKSTIIFRKIVENAVILLKTWKNNWWEQPINIDHKHPL